MPQAERVRDQSDPFNLARFTSAQDGVHNRALAELRNGDKRSHWMWFIFPQIDGLGLKHYAIKSSEAKGTQNDTKDFSSFRAGIGISADGAVAAMHPAGFKAAASSTSGTATLGWTSTDRAAARPGIRRAFLQRFGFFGRVLSERLVRIGGLVGFIGGTRIVRSVSRPSAAARRAAAWIERLIRRFTRGARRNIFGTGIRKFRRVFSCFSHAYPPISLQQC